MSSRRERMIADLDREIEEQESVLSKLREARKALAATLAQSRRPTPPVASPSVPTPVQQPLHINNNDMSVSIEAAAATVMADGQPWAVEDVASVLQRSRPDLTRGTVNSALYRGSKRQDGLFEQVNRGHYRVKKEVG